MSDIQQTSSIGYLGYLGDFHVPNTQVLGDTTALWQDAFARVMAQQAEEHATSGAVFTPTTILDSETGEPITGSVAHGTIVEQRACEVEDTERKPPEPLFLPIAEFEWDLADKPAQPFSAVELIEQQRNLDLTHEWVRPNVVMPFEKRPLGTGQAPEPRALFLPIAEFEWDLADKPAEPYTDSELTELQHSLDVDTAWTRPVVLQNVRIAA